MKIILTLIAGLAIAALAGAQSAPEVFTGIVSEVRSDGSMIIIRTDVDRSLTSGDGVRRVKTKFWGLTLRPGAIAYMKSNYLNHEVGVEVQKRDKSNHVIWGELSRNIGRMTTEMMNAWMIYEGVATWNSRQAPDNPSLARAAKEAPGFQRMRSKTKG